MISVTINDEKKYFTNNITIQELLNELQLDAKTVVVVVNDEIIEQARYETFTIKEGDRIELVRIVGGG